MKQSPLCGFVALLGIVLSIASARAETVTLASSGTPTKVIAIPTTASGSMVATGSNMRVFLNRITGGTFTSTTYNPVSGPPANAIVLGKSGDLNLTDILPNTEADRLKSENFIVATGTTTGNIIIAGASDRAVSHGVYELLEQMGCRWFFPGQDWEVLPSDSNLAWTTTGTYTTKTTTMGAVTMNMRIYVDEEPDYKSRVLAVPYYNSAGGNNAKEWLKQWNDMQAWNAANRAGEGEIRVKNSHSYATIVQWAKDHSRWNDDYYALVTGTDGIQSRGHAAGVPASAYQLCVANPDVIDLCQDYAEDYFVDYPQDGMISMEPNDGVHGWCECIHYNGSGTAPGCQDLKWKGYYSDTNTANDDDFLTDRVVTIANAVVDRLQSNTATAGKQVGILAYAAHSGAPHIQPRPQVHTQIAYGYLSKGMSMPILFQDWATAYSGTTGAAPNIGVYDYFGMYVSDKALPRITRIADLKYISNEFQAWNTGTAHAMSYKAESALSMGLGGLGQYIAMKKMWDVDADPATLRHDFLTKCFGPDTDPIYDTMDTFFSRLDRSQPFFMSKDFLGRMYTLLSTAYGQTSDPAVEKRLDALALYMRYCEMRMLYENLPDTLDSDKPIIQAAAEDIFKYVWQIKDTNMVDSLYLWKYGPSFRDISNPANAAQERNDFFDWPLNEETWIITKSGSSTTYPPGTLELEETVPGPLATTGTNNVPERHPWKVTGTYSPSDIQDMIADGITNNPTLIEEPRSYSHELMPSGMPGTGARGGLGATQYRLGRIGLYLQSNASGTLPSFTMSTGHIKDKGPISYTIYDSDGISDLQVGTVPSTTGTFTLNFAKESPNSTYIFDIVQSAYSRLDWTAGTKISMIARADWPYSTSGGQRRYFYVPKGTKNIIFYATRFTGTMEFYRLASSATRAIFPGPLDNVDLVIDNITDADDGQIWYIRSLNATNFFFQNIPGILAARKDELLIPKEFFAVSELVSATNSSTATRGTLGSQSGTNTFCIHASGTALPTVTITPTTLGAANPEWTLYDDDGLTVLDSGTLTSGTGVPAPLTLATSGTAAKTYLLSYNDHGGVGTVDWTAASKVSQVANIRHSANETSSGRRYFFVPKGVTSFSYSADSMSGCTFHNASGATKYTQAASAGPTGTVTVSVSTADDDMIWYASNLAATNFIFDGLPGHIARRPDELLIPYWTFKD